MLRGRAPRLIELAPAIGERGEDNQSERESGTSSEVDERSKQDWAETVVKEMRMKQSSRVGEFRLKSRRKKIEIKDRNQNLAVIKGDRKTREL